MTKILIVKTSSMGDIIHNLPIIDDIRAAIPDAKIDWVVEESFVDIVKMHPHVHQIIPVAWRRWRKTLTSKNTWREMRDFHYRLTRQHYDYVIDTQGLLKSGIIVKMANATLKCGYDKSAIREPMAARFYNNHFVIPKNAHAIERNRWLASAALGYYPDEHKLNYGIDAPLPDTDTDQPYIVFLQATSRAEKQWAPESWIELGNRLNQMGYYIVFPWGTEVERQQAEAIADHLSDAVILPKLKLKELAGWIKHADMTIGVDTGLLHLSAAFSRPTVGIYTATSPELTGTYESRFNANVGSANKVPSVDEVFDIVKRVMTRYQRQ
jgi:heptosyltransferase-1